MLKLATGRILLLVLGLTVLMVFSIKAPSKSVKTPVEIYKEADYLAHLEIIEEHKLFKTEKIGSCAGILIQHRNRYCILTVGHVKDTDPSLEMKEIRFYLKGQPGVYNATLYRSNTEIDCALLEISKIADKDFIFLGRLPKFGSGKTIDIGESVYSLGSPLRLKFSFGIGAIENKLDDYSIVRPSIIHSAPIAPGSSGGPLLNKYGEIIGINVAVNRAYTSFGKAIFIEDVLEWLNTIE